MRKPWAYGLNHYRQLVQGMELIAHLLLEIEQSITLRETLPTYHETNLAIRAASRRWPALVVADWNANSRGKPWFAADGLHLNQSGYDLWRTALLPVLDGSASRYQVGPGGPERAAEGALPATICGPQYPETVQGLAHERQPVFPA